ncbi:MAG: hypothetical protein ACK5LN_06195 [Propioniciclava sp.]
MHSSARRRLRGACLAAVVLAGLTLGSPAVAAPTVGKPPVARTTVDWVDPAQRASVQGTIALKVTGTQLAAVSVYAGVRWMGSLTVAADGRSATGELDTTMLPDGATGLAAIARGENRRSRYSFDLDLRWITVANGQSDYAPAGGRLLFADEFNGSELDRDSWCTRYQYGGGAPLQVPDDACLSVDPATGARLGTLDTLGGNGQEEQVYRDFNERGEPLHTVQNGYLSLTATHTRPDDPHFPYESAMIRSKQEFQPTASRPLYLTARVRMPAAQGSWPAFWLASGYGDGTTTPPWPPEIDILEGPLNGQEDRADMLHQGTIVSGADPAPQGSQEWFDVSDRFDTTWGNYTDPQGLSLRERWVEIGLEWKVDSVCFFVDGYKSACQKYTWVANDGPANPAAVLLNLGVGGPWAGRYGEDLEAFPYTFDIDHVRIYSY